jgi:hypothetical protein
MLIQKEMYNEDLIGTLALVHPDLANDPARKQGEVGVITYVGKENHEIYMSFPGNGEGIYNGNALLRLQDKNKILETLVNEGDNMELDDFKALYKITMLLDRNTSTGILSALEIARDNPNIWIKTLENASTAQNLRLENAFSR